jgi:hypothetical protein
MKFKDETSNDQVCFAKEHYFKAKGATYVELLSNDAAHHLESVKDLSFESLELETRTKQKEEDNLG